MSAAAPAASHGRRIISTLVSISDIVAAALLAADLVVVCVSVLARFLFNAPVEWADDVARGLMVGSSFFGAASALARGENLGVAFFIDMLPSGMRRVVDSVGALLVTIISGYVAFNALKMGWLTTGQTSGSGLPLEWTFYPMGAGALFMTIFALEIFTRRAPADIVAGIVATAVDRRDLVDLGFPVAGDGAVVAGADAGRILPHFVRRLADRLCAGAGRADLHLGRGHAARRHLRPADGARHRQFRAAGDPVLHPRRLPDGGERHVGSPDRAVAARGRADARRAQCRDGDVDGAVFRHLRLEDGRRRRRRLRAHSRRAKIAAEPGERGGAARAPR